MTSTPQASAVHAPQSMVNKPFSGYAIDSGVSPYMELFRRDSLSSVDNYNAYVKPRLQQRSTVQQFNGQIRGLQNNSRRQGRALQNLGREAQVLQGVSTPQYYMNTGNYYPGLGR